MTSRVERMAEGITPWGQNALTRIEADAMSAGMRLAGEQPGTIYNRAHMAWERGLLIGVLRRTMGHRGEAARILGIGRHKVTAAIKRNEIRVEEYR